MLAVWETTSQPGAGMGDWEAGSGALPSAGWLLDEAPQVQVPWGHRHPALSLPLALLLEPVPYGCVYKVLCPLQAWKKSLPCSGEQRLEQGNSRNTGQLTPVRVVVCRVLLSRRPKKLRRPELSLSCRVFRLGSSLPLGPQGRQRGGFAFIQLEKQAKMHH